MVCQASAYTAMTGPMQTYTLSASRGVCVLVTLTWSSTALWAAALLALSTLSMLVPPTCRQGNRENHLAGARVTGRQRKGPILQKEGRPQGPTRGLGLKSNANNVDMSLLHQQAGTHPASHSVQPHTGKHHTAINPQNLLTVTGEINIPTYKQ